MSVATLDIRTTTELKILTDFEKNFSVTIQGFEVMDTAYSLPLYNAKGVLIRTLTESDGITIGADSLVIAFTGSDYAKGEYTGELNSESKDADKFYRSKIELTVE